MTATPSRTDHDTVMRLTEVQKSFGGVVVVENMNLAVKRNQLLTLLGPSGCGKTTTLRMIAGFEYPSAGQVVIDGKDVTYTPPHKREIGMVFQSYGLFPHLRVSENVAYGLKRRGVPKEERVQRVREALEMVHLAQYGDRFPSELSGGQQQRVALARAIVIRPKILLLDEPLSALDAKMRQRMRFEIRHLQQQIGMTTVLVTHDQEEALSMSDQIVVMNQGRIEQEGTPAAIYQAPRTPFVASFIGETNLFEGAVVGPANTEGFSVFKADAGFDAILPNSRKLEPGRRVLISLRPETMFIHAHGNPPASSQNVLRGTLEGISYLGSRTTFEIKTASNQEILVSSQNSAGESAQALASLQLGQAVSLSWASESCQLVEAY